MLPLSVFIDTSPVAVRSRVSISFLSLGLTWLIAKTRLAGPIFLPTGRDTLQPNPRLLSGEPLPNDMASFARRDREKSNPHAPAPSDAWRLKAGSCRTVLRVH